MAECRDPEGLAAWDSLLARFCAKYGLTPQFCDYGDLSKNPDCYREFWFLSEAVPDCGSGVWIHAPGAATYSYCHNTELRSRKTRDADGLGIMSALAGSTIFVGKLPHPDFAVRIDMPAGDCLADASVYELRLAAEGVL